MNKVLSLATTTALLTVIGCTPREPTALSRARLDVQRAQQNPLLVERSPTVLAEVTAAYNRAEVAWRAHHDQDEADHLLYLTQQTLRIASQESLRKGAQVATQQGRAEARAAAIDLRAENSQARARADDSQFIADYYQQENEKHRELVTLLGSEIQTLESRETERGLELTLGDEVLFETGESKLKAGSVRRLSPLTDCLRNSPKSTVKIEGHTDSQGTSARNLDLSQSRASAVRELLVTQGIDPQRIVASGLGEEFPVATNGSAAGRLQNRRVQLIVALS